MALRNPISHLCKHASSSSIARASAVSSRHAPRRNPNTQSRSMATVVPPVTQDMTSSKGPTAMVFMNMGGPSTTDEVGVFLSRLFVSGSYPKRVSSRSLFPTKLKPTYSPFKGRRRPHPPRPSSKLPGAPHLPPPHPQNPKTIRRHRRRLSYPQRVRIPVLGNVQTPRPNFSRNCASQTLRRFPLRRPFD